MKKIILLFPILLLAACGPKIKLVPVPYMPAPPEVLMRAPKELNTINPVETPAKENTASDE